MYIESVDFDVLKFSKTRQRKMVSLSHYFPKNTHYFYSYPSGEESGFLNKVPPAIEELVSARPLVCAGEHIRVVTFANTIHPDVADLVGSQQGLSLLPKERIAVIPDKIRSDIQGALRNKLVKRSLKRLVPHGSLVMAQPFLDADIEHLYQISPRLINWLNDKQHMASFISKDLLAKRYALFESGLSFAKDTRKRPLPCVVKVSSSSAGDGVYICKDEASLQAVKKLLKNNSGTVIIEEYIQTQANYGIQFGIPENPDLPIDIIGVSEQLTTPEGEFIGGIIDAKNGYKQLEAVKKQLLSKILPHVRELGWYGVGCVDVLEDPAGRHFIVDCNFRMTGMSAYLMLAANQALEGSLMSFAGEYAGSLNQLQSVLASLELYPRRSAVRIIALTEQGGICRFNAALLFNQQGQLGEFATHLLDVGIASKALELFA